MKPSIIIGIPLVVICCIGVYNDIRKRQDVSGCVVVEHTDSYAVYNSKMGGSFVQVPATTIYVCNDGRIVKK